MRYAVIAKGIPLERAEAEATKVGAGDIRRTNLLNQLFCEMDASQAKVLARVDGLTVKPVGEVKILQTATLLTPVENISDVFYLQRSYFNPPLTRAGLTVAVLDSGIRKSHQALRNKVVYEANFTTSPSPEDVFGHGTQVAFIVAGGTHYPGEKAGISPGAGLFNIKVVGDDGTGSEEAVVLGIDHVCDLAEEARRKGLWPTDDLYPNVINLSLGGADDGDPDNPVRAACRMASQVYGLDVVAAAGNLGPKMTTITLPACDPEVIAVGAVETSGDLIVWEKSSRGPTIQGETKPDFVLWGTNIEMASHEADDEYVNKSGTSFAAPILSGLTGLLWESGRRAYGEGWVFRWIQARELAAYFTTKPSDAPLNKDNAYGYGLPAMGAMLEQMSQTGTSSGGMEMFPMLMMMALMAGMAGGA